MRKNWRKTVPAAAKKQAKTMRDQGMTLPEIGAALNEHPGTLIRWVGKASDEQLKLSKSRGNAKRYEALRAKWLPEATKLKAAGLSINKIRLKLGISKNSAYKYLKD